MQLADVNCTDILDAIRLGCRTMCNVFNADDDYIPFFASRVRPDACLEFNWAHSEAHVPGRHLNALLTAEAVAGVSVDEEAISRHARAAIFSYSGPVPMPLNRDVPGGPLIHFVSHNLREGFHALYALACFRSSARARELAEASIDAIFRYWKPDDGWDMKSLRALGLAAGESTFMTGIARAIGPLVKYYRATSYGPALDLALLLTEKVVAEYFGPGGDYNAEWFGAHTHSTTCVLSSLAQLADLLHDASLMQRVKAFYDNGLWQIRDDLGWVIENAGDDTCPDRGEANSTGDLLETALLLGKWGYTEYYADAERMLRGHLLPAQLRDNSFIVNPLNPDGVDGLHQVAERHLGAFGFPAPYGHQPLDFPRISFNMDIVGGVVGSLCEAYQSAIQTDGSGHRVNLLLDRQTDAVTVQSPYAHPMLRVSLHLPGSLFVRIPPWVHPSSVVLEGSGLTARYVNGYLFLASPPVNQPLSIVFPLRHQEFVLPHRTRDIRVRMRGDEVLAMDNFGADLTFFDPFE